MAHKKSIIRNLSDVFCRLDHDKMTTQAPPQVKISYHHDQFRCGDVARSPPCPRSTMNPHIVDDKRAPSAVPIKDEEPQQAPSSTTSVGEMTASGEDPCDQHDPDEPMPGKNGFLHAKTELTPSSTKSQQKSRLKLKSWQAEALKQEFARRPYIDAATKDLLGFWLELDPRWVGRWFSRRRYAIRRQWTAHSLLQTATAPPPPPPPTSQYIPQHPEALSTNPSFRPSTAYIYSRPSSAFGSVDGGNYTFGTGGHLTGTGNGGHLTAAPGWDTHLAAAGYHQYHNQPAGGFGHIPSASFAAGYNQSLPGQQPIGWTGYGASFPVKTATSGGYDDANYGDNPASTSRDTDDDISLELVI